MSGELISEFDEESEEWELTDSDESLDEIAEGIIETDADD